MSFYRALGSTSAAMAINLVFALVSSVIIARLLTPTEIGVYSISVSLLAFAHIVRDFGVGQYIVQLKDVRREDMQLAFTMLLLTSGTLALAIVACAPYAALAYGDQRVASAFYILALNFATLPFGAHILSILKREMAFGVVAKINIGAGVVQSTSSVAFAYMGQGSNSMAWGSLAGNIFMIASLFAARPKYALLPPTFRGLSKIFKFGSQSSLSGIVNRIGSSGPDLILGKTLGLDAVAQFSRSNSLLSMFAWKVDDLFLQVFTPSFAKSAREGADPSALLSRSIASYSLVQVSILLLLGILGSPMIVALFGEQWTSAAALSTWLALWSIVVVPVQLAPAALMASGQAGACLRANLISNIALVATLLLSIVLSLEWVVWLMIVYRGFNFWAWQREMRRHFDITAGQLLSLCRPSLAISIIGMTPAIAVEIYIRLRHPDINNYLHILGVGTLAVLGLLIYISRSDHPMAAKLHEVLGLARTKIMRLKA